MKINFYLPGIGFKIIGGNKVVYQYANFLKKEGHDVWIYYDINNAKTKIKMNSFFICVLKKILVKFYPYYWFKLNKKIKQKVVLKIKDDSIRNANISIATAYRTSKLVYDLDNSKGEKIYFIQDFEKWGKVSEEMLYDSYKLNMKKIVISKWLQELVDQYSPQKSVLISNGIDIENVFKCKNDIANRNNKSLLMLYHEDKRKGCQYGLEIIKKLKVKYPTLEVQMFGYPKKSSDIPNWVKYKKDANEKDVVNMMNKSAIYMCTSLQEGYGLPGLEAMACGCALVTTNCKGILEYANEENAMITEPQNVEDMYQKICYLIDNPSERIKLAQKGYQDVTKFKNVKDKFEEFKQYITGERI